MKCLVVAEKTISDCIAVMNTYASFIDMAEIRADFLLPDEMEKCAELPSHIRFPLIITIRLPEDGGHFRGSKEERTRLYTQALQGGYSYMDLEEGFEVPELDALATKTHTRIVRSFHDFDKVPENLAERIRALPKSSDDIAKAAVYPKTSSDFFRICEAARACTGMNKVVLGMGDFGFPTRLLACKLGSLWTYCAKDGDSPAPGHVSPRRMEEVYHYSAVKEDTKLFGIIGNPVMHTESPQIHNRGFRHHGINALYLPFLVDDPAVFFTGADMLGLGGLSVTIPHKQAVLDIASEVSPEAAAIGSANTMIRTPGGWKAFNTDAAGFIAPLAGLLKKDMEVLVAGAGGSARTILYALGQAGCRISIANRTKVKAEALANEFNAVLCDINDLSGRKFDLIVQAGSAGMHPQENIDSLESYAFTGSELVYDIVYVPEKTRMLARAEKAGCRTINGWPMLLGQAAEQFRLFCGRELPAD
ncbi:MAG: shikimate dehydrogenase [Spirochaetales bacterium]|nr:shikimate dehydrogenase [Spirochaetales bacterium]